MSSSPGDAEPAPGKERPKGRDGSLPASDPRARSGEGRNVESPSGPLVRMSAEMMQSPHCSSRNAMCLNTSDARLCPGKHCLKLMRQLGSLSSGASGVNAGHFC